MKGTLIDEKISIRSYACFNFSQGEKLGHEKLPLSILHTTTTLVSVLLFGKDLGKGCITVFSICSLEKSQGIRE